MTSCRYTHVCCGRPTGHWQYAIYSLGHSVSLLLLLLLLLLSPVLLQWPDEVPQRSLFVLSDKVRRAA
jgi:hypothetical protein